jgi:hypothetical protein
MHVVRGPSHDDSHQRCIQACARPLGVHRNLGEACLTSFGPVLQDTPMFLCLCVCSDVLVVLQLAYSPHLVSAHVCPCRPFPPSPRPVAAQWDDADMVASVVPINLDADAKWTVCFGLADHFWAT